MTGFVKSRDMMDTMTSWGGVLSAMTWLLRMRRNGDVGEYFRRHGLEDGQDELEWVMQENFEGLYRVKSKLWWTGVMSAMGGEWSSCGSWNGFDVIL
jgi:hypothetical protein